MKARVPRRRYPLPSGRKTLRSPLRFVAILSTNCVVDRNIAMQWRVFATLLHPSNPLKSFNLALIARCDSGEIRSA